MYPDRSMRHLRHSSTLLGFHSRSREGRPIWRHPHKHLCCQETHIESSSAAQSARVDGSLCTTASVSFRSGLLICVKVCFLASLNQDDGSCCVSRLDVCQIIHACNCLHGQSPFMICACIDIELTSHLDCSGGSIAVRCLRWIVHAPRRKTQGLQVPSLPLYCS
jgi:hypothetical protein